MLGVGNNLCVCILDIKSMAWAAFEMTSQLSGRSLFRKVMQNHFVGKFKLAQITFCKKVLVKKAVAWNVCLFRDENSAQQW